MSNFDKKQIKHLLLSAGLTEDQIAVYLAILTEPDSTPATIASRSPLKKGTIYNICALLEEWGIVEANPQKKTKHYRITHPANIERYLEQKKIALSSAQRVVTDNVHLLEAEYSRLNNAPVLQYYPGVQGIARALKRVIIDRPKEVKKFFTHINDARVTDIFFKHLDECIALDIHSKIIRNSPPPVDLPASEATALKKSAHLRSYTLIPDLSIPTMTFVYGQTVIYLSLDEFPGGIYIKNKDLADQQHALFDHLWNGQ